MYSPAISVLMPVYNTRENYLRLAIQSILDQTFEDFEFIIVNDCCTDNSPKILNEYAIKDRRIRLINNNKNLKIVRTLNRGLAAATAPLVARQDADDLSTVTRLEVQKKFMDANPTLALCGTGMFVINEIGKFVCEIRHVTSQREIYEGLKHGCPFVHGSTMFKRDVVYGSSIGGYSEDPDVEYAEDYDLWVKLATCLYPMQNIPNTSLYFHRNHPNKSSLEFSARQTRSTEHIKQLAERGVRYID